jgi:hypothetical protein
MLRRLIYLFPTIEVVYSAAMNSESPLFRLRALQGEQRARDASDPLIKAEWEELESVFS